MNVAYNENCRHSPKYDHGHCSTPSNAQQLSGDKRPNKRHVPLIAAGSFAEALRYGRYRTAGVGKGWVTGVNFGPPCSLTMRDAGPVLLDPPAALQKIVTPM